MRAPIHYLLAVVILALYGGQVCPYIDSLTLLSFGRNLFLIWLVLYLVRIPMVRAYIDWAAPQDRVRNSFRLDMALFLLGGFAVTFANMNLYEFPFGSGMKMVVGALAIGFFAAADLALQRERIVFDTFSGKGEELHVTDDYFPLTSRFSLGATVTIVMVTGIITLVIFRDIIWLSTVSEERLAAAHTAIAKELLFIAGVTLGYVLSLIAAVAKNLRLFFGSQNDTLTAATGGDLAARVTVGANHEFGVMGRYTNRMIEALQRRTDELAQTRDVTILSLASLAETRDNETGAHILRTQRYVKRLAEWLQENGPDDYRLNDETIDLLYKSAPLHDIGKVGIPDAILLKPGKLTLEEFAVMKEHPAHGRNALLAAVKTLGDNSFLQVANEIAYGHHEKWDGSGYPEGLKGKDIPLAARLMAVADVYDALISKRVYKPAFTIESAESIITDGRGAHFDPRLIDAFEACKQDFRAIAAEFSGA